MKVVLLTVVYRLQVSYFYDPECYSSGCFSYGPTAVYYGYRHPMKPHRITMTHSLLMSSPYWPSLHVRHDPPILSCKHSPPHSLPSALLDLVCTGGYLLDSQPTETIDVCVCENAILMT
jgi:hypothetical protein